MGEIVYTFLDGKIFERGYKKTVISKAAGMSSRTFRNKMKGISDWTYPETLIIQSTFFPDISIEVLFEKNKCLKRR